MIRMLLLSLLFLATRLPAQSLYYPPLTGDTWTTLAPSQLGWCPDRLDTLLNFVEAKGTKSFIILKDGRIVVERYFGAYTRDSLWYWASAGKSLMSFLIGAAREDGFLQLDDPTSKYLGVGWTSCTAADEQRIRLIHQLTMTSGLDDRLEDLLANDNCLDPECLVCLFEPGTRWAYHNAPYRLLQDVLEKASGLEKNIYTRLRLGNFIGMRGFWFNYIYYSTARDMARFGLLMLGRGAWNGKTILGDTAYYNSMIRPSQPLNPAYGYLWWLNGQDAYLLPGLQIRFPGALIPAAPADLYAALGKDDQKIYIVPSQGLVVVRQGLSAGGVRPAASSFDNQLWERIAALDCTSVARKPAPQVAPVAAFPNPTAGRVTLRTEAPLLRIELWNTRGQLVYTQTAAGTEWTIDLAGLPPGVYLVRAYTLDGIATGRLVKK